MYGTTNNTIINLPVFFWPIYGGFANSAFLGLPHYGKNYLILRHHLWPKTEGLGRLKPISDSKNAGDWDPEFWHWSGSLLLVLSALMVMFSHTKLMYVNSMLKKKNSSFSLNSWNCGSYVFFWGVLWPNIGIASKLPGAPWLCPAVLVDTASIKPNDATCFWSSAINPKWPWSYYVYSSLGIIPCLWLKQHTLEINWNHQPVQFMFKISTGTVVCTLIPWAQVNKPALIN